jgi:hypothetical protein
MRLERARAQTRGFRGGPGERAGTEKDEKDGNSEEDPKHLFHAYTCVAWAAGDC